MQSLKEMKTSTKCAWGLTLFWALVVAFVLRHTSLDGTELSVIDFANFAAYSCSFPALVWLIVGHHQHGQELQRHEKNFQDQLREFRKHNKTLTAQNEALDAQANELRALAKHTEALAKAAEAERNRVRMREKSQAKPFLIPGKDRTENKYVKTEFWNRGGEIYNISIQPSAGQQDLFDWSPPDFLGDGESAELTVSKDNRELPYPLRFTISCEDGAGYQHQFGFERTKPDDRWRQIRPGKELLGSAMPDEATATPDS